MYLSDRDLEWALTCGLLIVDPPPAKADPTSIDLHLGSVDKVRIWDAAKFEADHKKSGTPAEVALGEFDYGAFAQDYQCEPPKFQHGAPQPVSRRGDEIVLRPGGFLLWMTREEVGTPEKNPQYICFVDGKSTKARTGIIVHFTAPTIHGGWSGPVVLEIANLGPLTFVLREGDAIAQITVARISSTPGQTHSEAGSHTQGQADATGLAEGD
jgi:deoxycytidine triphosphate deaminase